MSGPVVEPERVVVYGQSPVHSTCGLRADVSDLRAIAHERLRVRKELEEVASVQVADLASNFVAGTRLVRLSAVCEAGVSDVRRERFMALSENIIEEVVVIKLLVLAVVDVMQPDEMGIFMAIMIDVERPIVQHLVDAVHIGVPLVR